MKKFFIILVGTLFCANLSLAQAQEDVSTEDFNIFRLSYGMAELENIVKAAGIEDCEAGRFNEVSMAFSHAISINPKVPVYLEMAADLSYIFGRNEQYFGDDDTRLQLFSVKFPVNLMYQLKTSKDTSIVPFIGVNAKVNILGKYKYSGSKDDDYSFLEEKGGRRRLNTGWQTGAYLNIDDMYIGFSYNKDLTPIYKSCDEYRGVANTNILKNNSIRITVGCVL